MISTIRLAEGDNIKASDSILQRRYLLRRKSVMRLFYRRLRAFCKFVMFWVVMRLSENITVRAPKCRSDNKHHCRRLIAFSQLAIFLVEIRFSENLTVRAPKCRSDDQYHTTSWNRWPRGAWQYLAIFWIVIGSSKDLTLRAPRCRSDGKHHKTM